MLQRTLTDQKLWDLKFLRGLAPGLLDGTGKSVQNLSTFLLRSLKAERCDFLGENHSGAEALSKRDSALVFLLLGTVHGQLQILQNR